MAKRAEARRSEWVENVAQNDEFVNSMLILIS